MSISKFKWVLGTFVLIGAILRFWFPNDIEFKYDEKFMFDRSQAIGKTEPWPALGMESGAGARNPALSIWVFVVLGRLVGAKTPVELAQGVEALNVLALVGLAFLAWFEKKKANHYLAQIWTWGLAFNAVNPISIILQRKIWAQSVLPVFCVLFIAAAFRLQGDRPRVWGFIFGLIGICLGQIHMSGFFYFAVVALWALSSRDRLWVQGAVLGGAIGMLPMLPWVEYMMGGGGQSSLHSWGQNILTLSFYQFWFLGVFGLNLSYSIGLEGLQLLHQYSFGIASLCLLVLGFIGVYSTVVWIRNRDEESKSYDTESEPRDVFKLRSLLKAVFWGFGLVLSVAPFKIYQHYLIVVYPFFGVWLSFLICTRVKRANAVLLSVFLLQVILSGFLFNFLHQNQGMPGADYGIAYQFQKR